MVNCVLFYTILLCPIVQNKYEIYPQLLGVNCLNQDFQDFRIRWLIGRDRCPYIPRSPTSLRSRGSEITLIAPKQIQVGNAKNLYW
jgi:hypothetical protein